MFAALSPTLDSHYIEVVIVGPDWCFAAFAEDCQDGVYEG
jgi:hypothetical protein